MQKIDAVFCMIFLEKIELLEAHGKEELEISQNEIKMLQDTIEVLLDNKCTSYFYCMQELVIVFLDIFFTKK